MPIPDIIASTRPLFGQSLRDKTSDLELLDRYARPEAIEHWLERVKARGAGAVCTLADGRVLGALRRRSDLALPAIPIMPNVMGLVREATEYGMMGAGFRRVQRMGLANLLRIGLQSLPRAPGVLKRDFGTILRILYDVEMSEFLRYGPPCAFLAPQIADLLMAYGNRRLLAEFADIMRRRYRVEPGLYTNNFGAMADALRDWQIDIRLILTPVNPAGWAMRPNKEACERHLRNGRFDVVAERITIEPPVDSAAIAEARKYPAVKSVMLDYWE